MLKGFSYWTSCEICLDMESIRKILLNITLFLTIWLHSTGEKKWLQVHLLLWLGFSIGSLLPSLRGVLVIAAKWHLLRYKAYYIMLWISQRAYMKQPQHVERLTVGCTVVQFFRLLLTFLILGWMCWLCWQSDLSCLITGGIKSLIWA